MKRKQLLKTKHLRKKSRAYRDLFQLLRNSLRTPTANEQEANDA